MSFFDRRNVQWLSDYATTVKVEMFQLNKENEMKINRKIHQKCLGLRVGLTNGIDAERNI